MTPRETPTRHRPPGAVRDAEPALDPARIADLRFLFPGDEIIELWHQLVATVSADLERAVAAAAGGEVDDLAGAAHSIGGSAHMIGAKALIAAVDAIERRARDARPIDRRAMDALLEGWRTALAAIEQQIAAHPRP